MAPLQISDLTEGLLLHATAMYLKHCLSAAGGTAEEGVSLEEEARYNTLYQDFVEIIREDLGLS